MRLLIGWLLTAVLVASESARQAVPGPRILTVVQDGHHVLLLHRVTGSIIAENNDIAGAVHSGWPGTAIYLL